MEYIDHFGFYNDASRYESHIHLSCEIIYVLEGGAIITSGEKDYMISKGQVCLMPVGVPHSTHKNIKAYKRCLVFLNPWSFGKVYFSSEIQGMLLGMICRHPLIADISEFGDGLFKNMEKEINSPTCYGRDLVTGQIIYMLSVILRENDCIAQNIPESLKTVMKVQMYIQENCSQQLRIEKIAEQFFTNKFYLTHIFTEYTGNSPKKFQIMCRMAMARRLLTESSLSLAEISEQCGFVSPSDMAKRFRMEYGVAPSEYRKNPSKSDDK